MNFEARMGSAFRHFAGIFALSAVFLASGCMSGGDSEQVDNEVVSSEQELFDSAAIDTTAKQALLSAGVATVASAFDIFNPQMPNQVEYCGLVVKKANGQYRAGVPATSYQQLFCSASISLAAGEKIVGYYHTHTPASIAGFSTADKNNANSTGRQYYVISTTNACAQRYNPTTKATTSLGCFPGSF